MLISQSDNELFISRPGRAPVVIATIRPEHAAQALTKRGLTPAIAQAVAYGALATLEGATALARMKGLVQ